MRAHCLQHEAFEDMGAIMPWLTEHNFDISYSLFFKSDTLPSLDEFDWLIIMGGSMSVNDEKEYKWLGREKEFIRQCINAGKVVIGICLGSQLIASSLGTRVFKNKEKEIGWFPVYKNNNIKSLLTRKFPEEITAFHWHGETFDLPGEAELIAGSEACKNQIFTIGNKVLGMQCHLETTSQSLAELSSNCRNELIPSEFIQSEEDIIKKGIVFYTKMHKVLYDILDELLEYGIL